MRIFQEVDRRAKKKKNMRKKLSEGRAWMSSSKFDLSSNTILRWKFMWKKMFWIDFVESLKFDAEQRRITSEAIDSSGTEKNKQAKNRVRFCLIFFTWKKIFFLVSWRNVISFNIKGVSIERNSLYAFYGLLAYYPSWTMRALLIVYKLNQQPSSSLSSPNCLQKCFHCILFGLCVFKGVFPTLFPHTQSLSLSPFLFAILFAKKF